MKKLLGVCPIRTPGQIALGGVQRRLSIFPYELIGVGLTLSATAGEPGTHPGEAVELSSLPASVQETIKQKAGSGEIVKVMREDDPDGKWNYEVAVKANGKESWYEVNPHGKFVREHSVASR